MTWTRMMKEDDLRLFTNIEKITFSPQLGLVHVIEKITLTILERHALLLYWISIAQPFPQR
jgi:hypothetical protein